ncbi:hypothetical protein TNCV_3515281 [Trichonephila clavipes]|nr:hypothetical protein TNCV_3515281 [Trichonephila clavipes]
MLNLQRLVSAESGRRSKQNGYNSGSRGLDSCVDSRSCEDAELGNEQNKYIRQFQIHQFTYVPCSLD